MSSQLYDAHTLHAQMFIEPQHAGTEIHVFHTILF